MPLRCSPCGKQFSREFVMTRYLALVLLAAMTALGTEGTPSSTVPADQTTLVTFNKDVLPILENNCQSCHRPGGIGPMSLLTYESARPWAKAIKTAVVSKKMPPWFADPHYGDFRNAPKLTESDIKTLVAWADNGSSEGNASDKPSTSREWQDGWRIQPDVVVSMPAAYRVPAKGEGEIKEFIIPSPFKEDTWVSSIEIRPGDPSVVHHVIVQIPDAARNGITLVRRVDNGGQVTASFTVNSPVVLDAQTTSNMQNLAVNGVVVDPARFDGRAQGNSSYSDVFARNLERQTGDGVFTTMEAVYAPGSPPLDFRYTDSAKLIPGGKPIRLEVHYTPNGKATTDKTMVGFTLANGTVERQFVIMAPEHLVDIRKPIPAGASNYETVGELTFKQDVELAWFMPHMHLRGKDMTYRLIFPDGRQETVLSAQFNFHWQLGYELDKPIKVPQGTRMVVTAHHDNSANNASNPTPKETVAWGEMTAKEMMLPWFGVIADIGATPEMIARYKPGDLDIPVSTKGRQIQVVAPKPLPEIR
jgi:mono/diheme cytochrome c family protein